MKKIVKIEEEIAIQIERVQRRLKGSVSSIDILNWLSNFQTTEHEYALEILSKVDYFTEKEIIELIDKRLRKLLSKLNNDANLIINPIGDYGKSGTHLMYYLMKTPIYREKYSHISIYETHQVLKYKIRDKHKLPPSTLILFDDFLGSGKSFMSYYSTFIEPQIKTVSQIEKVFIVTLFYLAPAKMTITKKFKNILIVGEQRNKCFSSRGSVFGYPEKMKPIREFSYKYGQNLFSTPDRKKCINSIHPLGYENSQALIIFPYNPPNNTLPILWSNKNKWLPLYPRSAEEKIAFARRYRKELAFEMSLLKHTEVLDVLQSGSRELGWKSFNFITKTDFTIFALMKMIRQKM